MGNTHPIVNLVTQALLVVFLVGLALLTLRTMLTMGSLLLGPVARLVVAIPFFRKLVTAGRGNPPSPEIHNVERAPAEEREPRDI